MEKLDGLTSKTQPRKNWKRIIKWKYKKLDMKLTELTQEQTVTAQKHDSFCSIKWKYKKLDVTLTELTQEQTVTPQKHDSFCCIKWKYKKLDMKLTELTQEHDSFYPRVIRNTHNRDVSPENYKNFWLYWNVMWQDWRLFVLDGLQHSGSERLLVADVGRSSRPLDAYCATDGMFCLLSD